MSEKKKITRSIKPPIEEEVGISHVYCDAGLGEIQSDMPEACPGIDSRHRDPRSFDIAGKSPLINALVAGWVGSYSFHTRIVQLDTSTTFRGTAGPFRISLTQANLGYCWAVTGNIGPEEKEEGVNISITGVRGSRHIRGWIGRRHFYMNEYTGEKGVLHYDGVIGETNISVVISGKDGNIEINGSISGKKEPVRVSLAGSLSPKDEFLEYAGIMPVIACIAADVR